MSRPRTLAAALLVLVIAACNDSGPAAAIPNGSSAQRTLSGTIFGPDDVGRGGVAIRGPLRPARGSLAGAIAGAVTDAQGRFVIQDPPVGTFPYEIDGAAAGHPFPFTIEVTVAPAGPTVLAHPVRMPDLVTGAASGILQVAGGEVQGALEIANGSAHIAVPDGSEVAIDGVPAAAPLLLTIAPLGVRDLPAPAPAGLQPVALAALLPAGATFDAAGDLFLATGLPLGTEVEIWAFDTVAGSWANLSDATGVAGVVADDGLGGREIAAEGVLDRSGWLAAMLPVDPACATTIEGTVRATFGAGAPVAVAGAVVRASTGQSAVTLPDGTYRLDDVPAYDPPALPACVPLDVVLDVIPPAAVYAAPVQRNVGAGVVVAGGLTQGIDVTLDATATGMVAGLVTDTMGSLAGALSPVWIRGPHDATSELDGSGAFFLGGLQPGLYYALHQFPGDPDPRIVSFEIAAGTVTTIDVQRLLGNGARSVEVRVLRIVDLVLEGEATAFSGAKVTLAGTDAASAAGLTGTTNDEGVVVFEAVDGPFSVTAQTTAEYFGSNVALAASVLDIDPADDRISVPLGSYVFIGPPDPRDAMIQGTVSNLPEGFEDPATAEEQIILNGTAFKPDGTRVPLFGFVEQDGSYMLPVPSGSTFEVVLVRNSFQEATLGALLKSGLGPIGPGESLTVDFDLLDPAYVPFDRNVDVTMENLVLDRFPLLTLRATAPSGAQYGFYVGGFFVTDPAATLTLHLPDLVNGPFRDPEMVFVGDFFDQFSNHPFPAAADAFTITFPMIPMMDAPEGALSLDDTDPLHVSMTRGPPLTGPNQLYIEGYGEAGLSSAWTVFTAPDQVSFDLPPAALPMFFSGHIYFAQACALELDTPIGFDTFFDGDLDDRIAMLTYGQSCVVTEFTVD